MADTADVQVDAGVVADVPTQDAPGHTDAAETTAAVGAAAPVESADEASQDVEAGGVPTDGSAIVESGKGATSDELTDEQLAALSTAELMELTHTACEFLAQFPHPAVTSSNAALVHCRQGREH